MQRRTNRKFSRKGRPGVSSIIGSIFFVLIMIVSIGSLVTIFNSFTSYNAQVNKAADAKIQLGDTELSASSLIGAFPPSAPSNFNVATTCAAGATSPTNQNKLFYAAGMWWDFFVGAAGCGSANFEFSTSFDGLTWEAATNIPNLAGGFNQGPYLSIEIEGTTIYMAIANTAGGHKQFMFGEGTLASGGTVAAPAGTITWGSNPATVTTANQPLGPIQVAVDLNGNQWVAVETASAIAVYERQACTLATAPNDGWEPNACSSGANPTNYAPTASPNFGALTASANMIVLSAPDTISSTGAIIIYESTGAAAGQTGLVGVIAQNTLASTSWNSITLTGVTNVDYALTASSAVQVGSGVYFAGLASNSISVTTGNLEFWALTLTSMASGSITADKVIETGAAAAWQAALTNSGTTFALFDNPSASTIQYYTSSTLGSSWSSAITLESAETAVNGLSPASGSFAVTWSNTAISVRFAALSTFTETNNSPFAVHLVDIYVYNTATNSLVAHWYLNSTEDFDYWIGQGSTVNIPIRFTWTISTSYALTVGTDNGATSATSFSTLA